jgi:hypothetical protein
VAEGRRVRREAAAEQLVARYTWAAVFTTPPLLSRLFGLPFSEVSGVVSRLAAAGILAADCVVKGWPGRWLVHASAVRANGRP